MTTDTSPESPAADLRRWACKQLELAPEASTEERRRAVLAELAQFDFTPPLGWQSAMRASGILSGGDLGFGLDDRALYSARRAWEESLREEIEAFAAEFFSLEVPDRIGRFGDLADRCQAAPALRARLEGLRIGLELPSQPPPGMSASMGELVSQMRKLFVERPHARAAQRLALLRRSAATVAQWRSDARRLQRAFPGEAALEPALIHELTSGREREKRRKRAHRKRLARRSVVVRYGRRVSAQFWWPAVGVFSIVLGVLLGISDNRRNPHTPAPRDPPVNQEFLKRWQDDINRRLQEGEPLTDVERILFGLDEAAKRGGQSPKPKRPGGRALERLRDL